MKALQVLIAFLLFISLGLFSCSSDDEAAEALQEQLRALELLSESVLCEDSSDWRVAGLGAKACGGPSGYIAYSTQIDTVDFLNRLQQYNDAVRERIEREGLISDCMVTTPPSQIQCQDGKAVLIYSPCELEPDPGPCFAAFRRYYYDKEDQQCKEFTWGGCGGTVPFETLDECLLCEGR